MGLTSTAPAGHAIRDPASTTYVAAIETAEEFGKRIDVEATEPNARRLYLNQEAEQRRRMTMHQNMLNEGDVQSLVLVLRSIDTSSSELGSSARAIEARCKTVIGSRCKQSGMFWTVRAANAILALRGGHVNGRFEDYWEARRA